MEHREADDGEKREGGEGDLRRERRHRVQGRGGDDGGCGGELREGDRHCHLKREEPELDADEATRLFACASMSISAHCIDQHPQIGAAANNTIAVLELSLAHYRMQVRHVLVECMAEENAIDLRGNWGRATRRLRFSTCTCTCVDYAVT